MTTLPADELVERLGRIADQMERFLGPPEMAPGPDPDDLTDAAALIEAQAAKLSSLRAKLAEAMDVVDAAKGLCFGEDWNKGSHAIKHGYRAKLISAIGKMFPDHPCAARRLIEGNGK